MAPKKEKLSKERFKELMTEHKIIFEGTVPPNKWPMQYKHHFHVIREIWATRYDEYKKRTDIDKRSIKKQKDRVKHLCRIARDLLQDIKTNESTWRHKVEDPVVGQFDEKVIWLVCSMSPGSLQTHLVQVTSAEMRRNSSQTTRHIPSTKTKRQNWKRSEQVGLNALVTMAACQMKV